MADPSNQCFCAISALQNLFTMPFLGFVVNSPVISRVRVLVHLRKIWVWGEQVCMCQRVTSLRIGGHLQLC